MKTKLLFLAITILSTFTATNTYAATYTGNQSTVISYTTTYVNNMNEVWNITTNDLTKPVIIYYNIGTESGYDFLTINEVDNNGVYTSQLLRISGTQSGFISTNTPNGKVQVVFTSDGSASYANNNSLYWGINVTFAVNNNFFVNNNLQTNGNAYIAGNLGVGTTAPLSKIDVRGEIRSSLNNGVSNFRMIGGSYGSMIRNDGDNTHFLLTNSNNSTGSWNSLRPWYVNNATGNVSFADGKIQITHSTGEVSVPVEKRIGAYLSDNFTYKTKTMGNYSLGWFTDNEASGSGPALWLSGYNGVKLFTQSTPRLTVLGNGNVGIGTTNPQYLLDVKGTIRATEVKIVSIDNFADYVFDKNYRLPSLDYVNNFIQTNGHLPEIPSAADVKENGVSLVDMQVKLLKKVEELTLYSIQQQEQIKTLKKEIEDLKKGK